MVCHLVNLSKKLGRWLHWDPAAEQFVGDDETNSLLSQPQGIRVASPNVILKFIQEQLQIARHGVFSRKLVGAKGAIRSGPRHTLYWKLPGEAVTWAWSLAGGKAHLAKSWYTHARCFGNTP